MLFPQALIAFRSNKDLGRAIRLMATIKPVAGLPNRIVVANAEQLELLRDAGISVYAPPDEVTGQLGEPLDIDNLIGNIKGRAEGK